MALPTGLNDLAKLALLAADAAYFTSKHPVPSGGTLSALIDTTYGVVPQYSVAAGFFEVTQKVDPNTGFGFIAYLNQQTNEVVVAIRGTDGPNPQDWVANSQYLGWNQWNTANAGRDLVFGFLDSLAPPGEAFAGKIHFTGQSLGGALAQYAAYDYVQSHQGLTGFSKTNVTLTTFNGFGGVLGLQQNTGGYDSTVLADIGSNAHFYTEGDIVSRLGSFHGVGHTGGTAYMLNAHATQIDPDTGEPFLLNPLAAHRIETGFYPFLLPGVEFETAVARPIEYLQIQNVQQIAAMFGRILNDQDVSLLESGPRLAAGIIAGLALGDPSEINSFTQAMFTHLHAAGEMSDEWYACLRKYDWGAIARTTALVAPGVTGTAYAASLLGAMLSDALEFQVDRHVELFSTLRDWVSSAVQTVDPSISSEDRRIQAEMMLALVPGAAIGSQLTSVLQPLALDINEFAQKLLTTDSHWLQETFNFLRNEANTAGGVVGSFMARLASAFVDVALDCGMTVTNLQSYLDNVIVPMVLDTANGIANAVDDFTEDIPNTLFSLGRTITSLADIRLVDEAYAAELNDPQLSSSVRAAVEEARETIQRAGQTVVIQKDVGPNPFHTPGYVPDGVSGATVEEQLGEVFRLSLPFAAGAGGQRVSLQLQGPQANQVSVMTADGVQQADANGTFQLLVPEGSDQVRFTLLASKEVSSDAAVTLSAMLVDDTGQQTHTTQVESVVSVKALVGNSDDRYEEHAEDYSWITDPTAGVAMGVGGLFHQTLIGGAGSDSGVAFPNAFGDDTLYGNGGNDYLSSGRGHDMLFGGDGNDILVGDLIDHIADEPWTGIGRNYRTTLDGTDYLDGGPGDDRVGGGGGSDRLIGGLGDDTLWGDAYTEGYLVQNPDGSATSVQLTGVLHPGDDILEGGAGNDKLSGDGGDDILDGGLGDDLLVGDTQQGLDLPVPMAPGDDYLLGGDGNDELQGNAGHDVLVGGDGDDRLFGDDTGVGPSQEGDDWLEGGDGNDFLTALGGDDTLVGDDGEDILLAGTGDDTLLGGEGNDIGFGGEGDDDISAGAGADQFNGEAGNDVMFGDAGDDLLIGGDGLDELDGGADNDLLIGGVDDDTLLGRDGNDELQGNEGNDLIVGGAGDDQIFGQEGNDELFGSEDDDALRGDAGDDLIDGGDGNDILVGDADGQIGGNGGDDLLTGGAGNDVLVGGGGQDTYFFDFGDGFDIIHEAAGEGNRLVFGSGISPSAIIAAMGPNDSLILRTGSGDTAVQIENFGTNNLNGLHPIDSFHFADGTVLIYSQLAAGGLALSGGLGNDQLNGTTQEERIFGGAGNDSINAGSGNDILLGGTGDDALFGGAGQDTYVFSSGGDTDVIQDALGEGNKLVFGAGISSTDLSLGIKQVVISGGSEEEPPVIFDSLVVRVGSSGDAVHIVGFDPANPSAPIGIEQFQFADGTSLSYDQLIARGFELVGTANNDTLNGHEIYRTVSGLDGDDFLTGGAIDNVLHGGKGRDVLFGNGGNDRLFGGIGDDVLRGGDDNDVLDGETGNDSLEGEAGDDVLAGGTGDDQLLGGDGSDIYRFNIGDGLDSLFDSGSGADTDTVAFGSGITSNSVSLSSQFGQIVIKVGAGSDGIQSGSVFDVFGSQTIEQFQFEDGTSLTYTELVARGFTIEGTESDDLLTGTNLADRLQGGLGNDRLEGGEGNDSYFFNAGEGVDAIMDTASVGAGNEVVFGAGITTIDLYLDLVSDQSDSNQSDLLIRIGANGDTIQLDTFDRENVLGPRTIESFRFDDGSTLTYEQLLAGGFDLTGTDNDDHITGTNAEDRIVAGDGADVLRSGLGDDTLDGGVGPDRLIGGQGNDTYLFGRGAGQDTLVEFQGGMDSIRMASGVVPSDVIVTRSNNDLVLSLSGGADRLTVSLYFLASPLQIELVQFADGTVWDRAFIENLTKPVITGTEGPDFLIGTSGDDCLVGLAGDDQLIGLGGSDLLDGGPGVDQLAGGIGDDQYIVDDFRDAVTELMDEGIDTVWSSVTRTLETDVENLTLTGSAAINGTGNAHDNVLIGNSGANVLTGGAGNDTYVMDAGDTVVELTGEGMDTVQTGSSAMLEPNVESLMLTGSASLIGVGNELDNVLRADGSISVLAGGGGNDTYVIGSNGDDDILVETDTGGIDTVIAGHDYRLPANIEQLTLLDPRIPDFSSFSLTPYGSSEQSVTGYGNNVANTLIGGRANNVLDGGLGADTLIGGAGNDTYVVDNAGDIIIEGVNEGVDNVQSTVSYGLSANVENLTLGGAASINGIGNGLNNDVRGNDASNVLDGRAGNDALLGFGGSDTYLFGRDSGRDTVFDSEALDEIDTIQFDSAVTPEDVEVYRNGFNLELAISGTTDELTLLSFFDSPEYGQKQARFSDGTVWSSAELSARALIGNTITGSSESDVLSGGAGHDLLIGSAGNDVLMGGRGKDTLYGDLVFQPTSGPQVIGDDTLVGGVGDDTLIDFRGANLFDGGAGDDTLIIGTGVDRILFGRGSGVDHVMFDNNRNDIDIIQMAADVQSSDVVLTWRSDSVADLVILAGGEKLTLQLSTDSFAVGTETTQAIVRFADDTQWSIAWSSSNVGIPMATSADDVLSASFPATLAGLEGNDTYLLGSSGVPGNYVVIEAPGQGIDTVQSVHDYTLPANVENLFLMNSTADNGAGNELDNLIVGNTRDNILDGGAGNDVLVGGIFRELEGPPYIEGTGSDILIGGEGDDILMGDAGNLSFVSGMPFLGGGLDRRDIVPRGADDLLIGGVGNDTYLVHSQEQTVAESENEGTDTVKSTVSYILGEHLENLELISAPTIFDEEDNLIPPPPLNGTGNELDNVLIGSEDANLLSGLTGHDTLVGRPGNDMLQGGAGHDTYLFNIGDGIDTIEDTARAEEGNRIQFGVGISRNDLTVTHDKVAQILMIQVGMSGTDQLRLINFDPTGGNGSLVAQTLSFADGSTVNLLDLFAPSNQAPTVATPLADQTVDEGVPFTILANAFIDPNPDDVLTYSASLADGSALPAWLNFDATTQTFSGTPDDAQVGELDLKVTVTDSGNLTVSDVFALTVTNANEAPTVFVPFVDHTVLEDASVSIQVPVNAFMDQDTVHGDVLTYSASLANGGVLPTWLSFDSITRTFTGTALNGDVGVLNVSVTATDTGGLSATNPFMLTVQNVNDAPMVANSITDQSAAEDSPFTFTMPSTTFADVDVMHGDQLTYSATLADGGTLPDWLSFNPTTRIFSGTPGPGDAGMLTINVTVMDNQTAGATDQFILTVSGPLPLTVTGTAGNDVLAGARGNDTLSGGMGNDTLTGGDGHDTYLFNKGDGIDTITDTGLPGEGNVLQFGAGITADDLNLGEGSLLIRVGGNGDALHLTTFDPTNVLGLRTIETFRFADGTILSYEQLIQRGFDITGTVGHDHLTGTNMDDRISGLGGNDTLSSGAGDDVLDGGSGTDTMRGGGGNDTYIVDAMGDVVGEDFNEGIDTVRSYMTYTLGINMENLTLAGMAAINGTGNALDNILLGNSANNILNGGAGHDRLDGGLGSDMMFGGTGDDLYIVNQAGDVVTEQAGQGSDTVESSITHILRSNVESLTLTGSSDINGMGNSAHNVLLGNSGDNTLDGGSGNDLLDGGMGRDALFGGSGHDRLFGGFGDDNLNAGSGNDLLNGGEGSDRLDGGSGDDRLLGGAGNDRLTGGRGADQFTGGSGNDLLAGNSGNDVYDFSRGDGQDIILDSDSFLGNQDQAIFDATINPLDLVISRQANDLRLAIHGSTDQVTVKDWYVSNAHRVETIQAGNGEILLSTQVDQLIQAMVSFTQQTGLTWDQAIDQRPQEVQAVLAATWQ